MARIDELFRVGVMKEREREREMKSALHTHNGAKKRSKCEWWVEFEGESMLAVKNKSFECASKVGPSARWWRWSLTFQPWLFELAISIDCVVVKS